VEHAGGDLIVNGRKIKVYSESDAAMINWADCGAEYIIESTGANNTTDKASRHFKGGAKAIRDSRSPEDDHSDTCSMCGKFCAVRSMNKALAGEYIDIL
jgi:glyceraldehyde 3-phosphate dehydrogenase